MQGSLTNHIMARATNGQPKPTVGMGATILRYTDRDAGTIIQAYEIKGGYDVIVQEDSAKRADSNGMSDCQTYEYTPDPKGRKTSFRFTPAKGWREVHTKANGRVCLVPGGARLTIGTRRKYFDYSF